MPKPRASRPYMPGYGIADAKGGSGLLAWQWAKERLEKGRTYFLATTDPTGSPHVMPVWGVWFADAFFFSTGSQSRKARNLAANSRCSIATEIDFSGRPKKGQIKDSIIVEGVAEVISDARIRKKFSSIYEDKYAWDMEDFNEPIYRVRPRVVFGLTSEFTQTATRWIFDH
jgi:nitroimidazol reductase NimA-like FMN-containing flavoprotein (pyridoxamine 5'-phosphate oxidase superfamily)